MHAFLAAIGRKPHHWQALLGGLAANVLGGLLRAGLRCVGLIEAEKDGRLANSVCFWVKNDFEIVVALASEDPGVNSQARASALLPQRLTLASTAGSKLEPSKAAQVVP